jgi:hypothetical protein
MCVCPSLFLVLFVQTSCLVPFSGSFPARIASIDGVCETPVYRERIAASECVYVNGQKRAGASSLGGSLALSALTFEKEQETPQTQIASAKAVGPHPPRRL